MAPPFSPKNALFAVKTLDPALLPTWRKARANVRTGTARAKVALVGDSTTYGYGASTDGTGYTGSRARSYATTLAAILSARGLRATANSFFGDGNNGANLHASDPRITLNGTWGPISSVKSLGGLALKNGIASNDTTTLSFGAVSGVDSFDFWYVQTNNSLGTFTANIDGGSALATINSNASPTQIVKASVGQSHGDSTSVGSHTLNIQRNGTGGSIYVVGVDAYDSTTKDVAIWNMGWRGAFASDWAASANGWDPLPSLGVIAPDLTIISLGINEWLNAVSVDTFTTNLQAIITKAKLSGDVILIAPEPTQIGGGANQAPAAAQAAIIAAVYGLAATNGCPVIDFTARFGSQAAASTAGLYFDNIHPNALGYSDKAELVADALLRV